MNKLKELRKKVRKNNKGFSLVELIVVIVILAILIGVTIGGIYQYVNKSRINTDINNAASIQSTLATIATDKDIYDNYKSSNTAVTITWTKAAKITTNNNKTGIVEASSDVTFSDDTNKALLLYKIGTMLTDGFPESKSNGSFQITITPDGSGNIAVSCKAYKGTTPATGEELEAQS